MSENKKYGYTGKGLRVDLTTGKITVEPTFPRFDGYIGGTAFGYKVFWDEVPPETDCYAPENKLVIAPGPLSGTGAICSGRTAITTLWPTAWPRSLIASAHVGGELAHKLKFAGWDFVIIEGEAKSPVYLYIHNEKVEIRDASAAWGQGTRRSAEVLAKETTPEASFGVIGQAGENLVPMSNMMVDKSHSAGGLGSVMGKKHLKGIVVYGNQAIHIHADPKEWEELIDSHRKILGAHTHSIVSRKPHPMFEYHTPASRWFFPSLLKDLMKPVSREACLVGSQTMDDLGLWCNYGQLHRDFCTMYTKGYFKKYLPEEEYKSIDWSKIDNPDPRILQDILPRIAYRKGEFGRWMGETTPVMLEHFGLTEDEWKKNHDTLYWSVGHPKHHGNENDGQIGTVLNCMYNRDPMSHGHINFSTSGLPLELQREIAAKFWGDGSAVDGIGDYRPTNKYKMIRLRWVIARKELHDMLGICSWTAPWELSPLRERGYIGDIEMESKVFKAVTGISMTQDELDKAGLRAFLLQRLYTMRQLKTKDMRHVHDRYPDWIFDDAKGRAPFTKGTIRMEHDDIEKSFDLFFELMDFDVKTGAPTEKCLNEYGLAKAVPVMKKEGLL